MTVRIGTGALAGVTLALWAAGAVAADTSYGYDVHGQLVSVGRTAGSATYAYDKAGNRTQLTAGAGTTTSSSSLQASAKSTASTTSEATAFILPQLLPENAALFSQKSSSSKSNEQ